MGLSFTASIIHPLTLGSPNIGKRHIGKRLVAQIAPVSGVDDIGYEIDLSVDSLRRDRSVKQKFIV